MNKNSSIIKQNDNLVSRIVKKRDPFCRLRVKGCTGRTQDPAHCFGRGNMSTRWILKAIYGACRACHSYVDTHPKENEIYFTKIMGVDLYEELKKKSNQNVKYLPSDLKEIHKYLKNHAK